MRLSLVISRLFSLSLFIAFTTQSAFATLPSSLSKRYRIDVPVLQTDASLLPPEEVELPENRSVLKGTMLTVDTRDAKACAEIQSTMNGAPAEMCRADEKKPLLSIVRWEPVDPSQYPASEGVRFDTKIPDLQGKEEQLAHELSYGAVLGVAAFVALAAMPASVTNWETEEKGFLSELPGKWKKNVRSGPVRDTDDAWLNYVAHPIAGAFYYSMARHSGYGILPSFGLSVLLSTFFWEYGIESFAETPSIQDLWITPILGSILGELCYQGVQAILRNDDKLLGSRALAEIAKAVLDPAALFAKGFEKAIGDELAFVAERTVLDVSTSRRADLQGERQGWYMGLRFDFKFR